MNVSSDPQWVAELCTVPLRLRTEDRSTIDLVRSASPDLNDRAEFVRHVASYLREHPGLIEEWARYSADKRMSRGPYFRAGTPAEVGCYADGYKDVSRYDDPADACSDFVWREVKRLQASPYWTL